VGVLEVEAARMDPFICSEAQGILGLQLAANRGEPPPRVVGLRDFDAQHPAGEVEIPKERRCLRPGATIGRDPFRSVERTLRKVIVEGCAAGAPDPPPVAEV